MSLRNHNLGSSIDLMVAMDPVAAGTTDQTSQEIDMKAGGTFDSLLVLVRFGVAAPNNTVHVEAAESSGGGFVDLAGSLVASDANRLVALDCPYVPERFLRAVVARGTASAIDFVLALKYHAKDGLSDPSEWTSSASHKLLIWPTTSADGA